MYPIIFFFTLPWSVCLWLNLFLIETREYFWLVKPEVSILSYIQVCAIKAPGFGENRKANLDDLAIFTGAEVMQALESLTLSLRHKFAIIYLFNIQLISEDRGLTLDKVQLEMLGTAKKVVYLNLYNIYVLVFLEAMVTK